MPYEKLANAKNNEKGREHHFANLNYYSSMKLPAQIMAGKYWEINESIYNEFLEVLPPRNVPYGFAMIEFLTEDITCFYLRINGRYWAGYAHCRNKAYMGLIEHIIANEVWQN